MKSPFFYLIFALIFTAILIFYNQMGGFREPEITYEPVKEYTLAGRKFKGKASDPAMEQLFSEMKQIKEENQYQGSLVMVWYKEVSRKNEPVEVFIGIEVLSGEVAPEQLETIILRMGGVIRAKISAHTSVMPSPERVLKMIRIFAEKNSYKLQDIVIDKYPAESVVLTEIPVRF